MKTLLGGEQNDYKNITLQDDDDDKLDYNDYENTMSNNEKFYLPTNIIFPWSIDMYLFNWMSSIVSLGEIKKINKDDMLRLPSQWNSKNIFTSFKYYWNLYDNKYKSNVNDINKESNTIKYEKININDENDDVRININDIKTNYDDDIKFDVNCKRLWWSLHSLIFYNFWYSGLCRLFNDLLLLLGVYLIKAIILASSEKSFTKLFFLAVLLTISNILQSIFLQQFIHGAFVTGSIVVSASSSCVLHSVLSIRMHRVQKDSNLDVGKINNIYGKDAASLREFVVFFHNLWACPLMIILCIISLLQLLGFSGLVALVLLIMLLPIESRISKKAKAVKKEAKTCADKRMSYVNELIDGYKTAKLTNMGALIFNWVSSIRKNEMDFVWKSSMIENVNMVISKSASLLITLITLSVFIIILSYMKSQTYSADKIFAALTVINLLGRPLQLIPKCVSLFNDAVVSCERIQSLINEAQRFTDIFSNADYDETSPLQQENGIIFRNVSVKRGDSLVLKDLDFEIEKPGLYVIVGDNGSGKTSLLLSMMQELKYIGYIKVSHQSNIAYLAHNSWICKSTAKENILLATSVDKMTNDLYFKNIRSCDLEYDFQEFIRGDNTVIDENSVSGGQKQRIALARALCSNASIFLLDNSLSALDYKVSQHVFHEAVLSKSRSSIVILTTHNKDLLRYADYIIQLESGAVSYFGSKNDYFSKFNASSVSIEEKKVAQSSKESKTTKESNYVKKDNDSGDITESSSILSAILYYVRACTYLNVVSAITLTIASYAAGASADYYIVFWTDKSITSTQFLLFYSLMFSLVIALNFSRFLMYSYAGIVGSLTLHSKLLSSVVGASFSFFNSTPSGRIASRFSSDLDVIDYQLPGSLSSLVDSVLGILTGVGVVCVTAPYYIIFVIPLTLLYLNIQRKYRLTSLEFKKIEAGAKSPLYTYFREVINGLDTIRGYRIDKKIIDKHNNYLDDLIKSRMNWDAANRWLGIRLDLIGSLIISTAAFSIVLSSASSGLAGIMLSYAIRATQSLSFAVRAATATENLLTSLDRVKEFCGAEQEDDSLQQIHVDQNISDGALEITRLVTEEQPTAAITVKNISARYTQDLPLSLKSVSFSVLPGQIFGICGRTGSGKSTLALVLSRLLPITSGSILLGKKNINTLKLSEYRNYVRTYPQDAYIFSGTLRSYLDPSNIYSDMKLNQLLSEFSSELCDNESDMNNKELFNLELKLSPNGNNLSAGQKQILTLLRAVLTNNDDNDDYTKIVVLDEITSNLNIDIAKKIISLIKKEISSSLAVLLISHRIADLELCDKLLLLSDGEIVSEGSPELLLTNIMN